jgi:hypothetical protein
MFRSTHGHHHAHYGIVVVSWFTVFFFCWVKHCLILKVKYWKLLLIIEIQTFITWRLVKLILLHFAVLRLRCICVAVFPLCLLVVGWFIVGGWRLHFLGLIWNPTVSQFPSIRCCIIHRKVPTALSPIWNHVRFNAYIDLLNTCRLRWWMTYYVWCHISSFLEPECNA